MPLYIWKLTCPNAGMNSAAAPSGSYDTFVVVAESATTARAWIGHVLYVVTLAHVAVAIHEAAHAAAMLLCGFYVGSIRIGEGRVLYSTNVCNVAITLRETPTSGYCYGTGYNNRRHVRSVIYAAGPVASLLWTLAIASITTPLLWPALVVSVVFWIGCESDIEVAFAALTGRRMRLAAATRRNVRPVAFTRRRARRESSARRLHS